MSIIKQMITGIDGITVDPARLIGYGSALASVAVFLFDSAWCVVHSGVFDPQAFGIGAGALMAGVMAVGVGVGAKAKTEPGAGS